MQLKFSQLEPLARHIIKVLKEKKLANFGQSDENLASQVASIFKNNFEQEQKLNDEAQKLLDINKKKIGQNIDEEKAFSMIKRQLAKEKNFVL
ncbi:MAG: DUF507 family protein [Deltaproteobacteria bacterium]|nr:DUF507 family protein [Deltaproteobacteria bacterium]